MNNFSRGLAFPVGLVLVFLFFGVETACGQTCDQTLSPGTNIASAVAGAANAKTICLANGDYGNVNLFDIARSGFVTVQSANPKGAKLGYVSIGNSDNIRIENMVIDGAIINSCSTSIQLVGNKFTSGMVIRADGCTPNNNLNYLIDSNTFLGLTYALWEGRLSIGLVGSNSGIVITNNIFGDGGCSDGIQLVGGVGGVRIGPGNIFRELVQGSCGPHVDAIQAYGDGPGNIIEGNYFYHNTVNIGIYDGASQYTVVNNVFDTPNDPDYQAIQMGGIQGMLMEHNTFKNTVVGIGTKSANTQNSKWTVQNNIFDNSEFRASGDKPGCGSDCILRYNLKSNGGTTNPSGTNSVSGNALFSGPGSIENWAGWQLATGSPGKNAGNDGKDMGTLYYGMHTGSQDTCAAQGYLCCTSCASGQQPALDNTCSDQVCCAACSAICIAGDLNCDKKVDIFDLVLVAQNYGKTSGFDIKADANKDGKIDIFDLVIVAQNYGKTGP